MYILKMKPITSYGIILYHKNKENQNEYLLYQRRDSFEYMDFLRGHYPINKIHDYICRMTIEERDRLLNYTFEELWNDLWVTQTEYINRWKFKGKKRYEDVKLLLPEIIKNTNTIISSPSWCFPKGKRIYYETFVECALREFEEETTIDKNKIIIREDLKTFEENFFGSDNKLYKTLYFVGYISEKIIPEYKKLEGCIRTKTLTDEAGDVKWLDFDSALLLLSEQRKQILKEVDNLI